LNKILPIGVIDSDAPESITIGKLSLPFEKIMDVLECKISIQMLFCHAVNVFLS